MVITKYVHIFLEKSFMLSCTLDLTFHVTFCKLSDNNACLNMYYRLVWLLVMLIVFRKPLVRRKLDYR